MLIRHAPKFGNDDDYADEEAVFVVRNYSDSMKFYTNPRGGRWVPSVYSLTGNVGFGWRTGPTPDGRRGGELLNDNICPMQGRDLKGPTNVVKSLSKIDATLLDAQRHPENYKDLLIRVSGYSAYFVELGQDVQDHLIQRTLHQI